MRACLDRESHEKHVNVLWGGWGGGIGVGGGGEWEGGYFSLVQIVRASLDSESHETYVNVLWGVGRGGENG